MTTARPNCIARLVRREETPSAEPLFPRARLLSANGRQAAEEATRAHQELEETRHALAAMRAAAQAEIAQARAALEREAEAIRRAAQERGGEEGRTCWAALVRNLEHELNRLQAEVPQDVQELALLIARRIIDIELTLRPEALLALVQSVLRCAKLYREIIVVLHPDDYAVVAPHAGTLRSGLPAVETFEVRSDPDIPRHGVHLVTNRGLRDGSVDTQLAILARRLAEFGAAGPHDPEPLQ